MGERSEAPIRKLRKIEMVLASRVARKASEES